MGRVRNRLLGCRNDLTYHGEALIPVQTTFCCFVVTRHAARNLGTSKGASRVLKCNNVGCIKRCVRKPGIFTDTLVHELGLLVRLRTRTLASACGQKSCPM